MVKPTHSRGIDGDQAPLGDHAVRVPRVLLSHRSPPSSSYPLVADILPPKSPLSLAVCPSHFFHAIPLTPLLSLSKY